MRNDRPGSQLEEQKATCVNFCGRLKAVTTEINCTTHLEYADTKVMRFIDRNELTNRLLTV